MTRLLLCLLLALAALGLTAPVASARPLPELCIQYNDPIHMGSYPVCPLN